MSFRLRRLIRHLKRSRHASVQDAALHEIHRGVRRSHGLKPPKAPAISGHGTYRPLTRKAKGLLARLRTARQYSVKKNILGELAREMKNGRRLADRARLMARRAADRAKRAGRAFTRKDGAVRRRVIAAHGRHLARAERRQREREAGTRKMPIGTRAARAVRNRLPSRRSPYHGPFRSRRAHRRWGRQKARREVPGLLTWFAQRRGWQHRSPEQRAWTHRAQAAQDRAQRRRAAAQGTPGPVRSPRPPSAPRARRPARTPARTR
jgi:hypothetical protein